VKINEERCGVGKEGESEERHLNVKMSWRLAVMAHELGMSWLNEGSVIQMRKLSMCV